MGASSGDGRFDYVGAGSAGCVLAGRLTEDPDVRVLLLEAGGSDDRLEVRMPAVPYRLFKTEHDWNYTTAREAELAGRRLYWPRGKLIGGSSSINAMLYVRGNRPDYDSWRDDYGCRGWGYDDLPPYFLRSEDQARGADAFHAVGGPLRVEDPREPHAVARAWIEAAIAAGIAENRDFNARVQDGAGMLQLTQKAGRPWSAADAFLHPAAGRPNLTVCTGALAERIVIEHGAATGVQYLLGTSTMTVHAEREILLAAGAVNSPQLLMLSGVGPADPLQALGIGVQHDSPDVGGRLQDHPIIPIQWYTRGVLDLYSEETERNEQQWQRDQTGPMTSSTAESCAFVRTDSGKPAPDLQFMVVPALMRRKGLPDPARPGMSMAATLVDVASRGRITLSSDRPDVAPTIEARYLSEPGDVATLLAGIDLACDISSRNPLRPYLAEECLPGAVDTPTLLAHYLQSIYHPTSSVAMGPNDDDPLDLELRVRGIDRLRVVDASAMPAIPRGNTNAPTIALAERAVDLIRGAAAQPQQHTEQIAQFAGGAL